ncbi:MAG: hypothetical protein SV760_09875, partial [Halobacteria archaeon]|nr:hypothetical protein [Halobacteria archaeon]
MARRIRPLNGLERILGRLEEVSDDFETDLEAEFPDSGLLLSGIPVDVIEREEEILVKADVPGFEKDDLRIQANAD